MQQAGTAVYQLDDMDFGRRLAVERELERSESGPGGALRTASAVFDESGNFLMYPTMLGIKGGLKHAENYLHISESAAVISPYSAARIGCDEMAS